jgi:hypothetical protein
VGMGSSGVIAHAKTNSVALSGNPRFCDCDQAVSGADS